MSKTHANRQIDAAEVAAALTPIGVTPSNEAQARELAPLDEEAIVAAWREAQAQADTHGSSPLPGQPS